MILPQFSPRTRLTIPLACRHRDDDRADITHATGRYAYSRLAAPKRPLRARLVLVILLATWRAYETRWDDSEGAFPEEPTTPSPDHDRSS